MLTRVGNYKMTKKNHKMEFQHTHEQFNVPYAIDCFIKWLNSITMIEIKEKNNLQHQCTADINYVEFDREYTLPTDDSDSDGSTDSYHEGDRCNSSNLIGSQKQSFVRRLEKRLKFLFLPSPSGIPPPYSSNIVKKAKLITYFVSAGIESTVYETWFTPL